MSKFFKSFLSLLLIAFLFTVTLNVKANEANSTEVGEAKYVEGELVEENYLKAGVLHQNYHSSSSSNLTGFNAAGSGGGGLNEAGKLYPQNVNLLFVPNTMYARVVNWTKTNNYGWARGTVKDIAKDFENHNPGWKVIAAVNGDFFDINSTHALPLTTSGSFVGNGEVLKTVGKTVLGFTNSGDTNTLIGNVPIEFTKYFVIKLYNDNNELILEQRIDNVNPSVESGKCSCVKPTHEHIVCSECGLCTEIDCIETEICQCQEDRYEHEKCETCGLCINPNCSGETTLYYSYPTIVSGEGASAIREYSKVDYPNGAYLVNSPERCIPYSGGQNGSFFGKGVGEFVEANTLKYTQFAVYTDDSNLKEHLNSANKIVVQRNVVGEFENADNISGTGQTLIYNGEPIVTNDKNRHPRTMIGVKEDGTLVLCTVDGRQPQEKMYGMTYDELSALMYHYGCVAAYNMDGGGSTTMVIREGNELRVLNSPSDGNERHDSNAILIVIPEISLNVTNVTDNSLVINAPQDVIDVEISNIEVTVDNQTYKLTDSVEIKNLKSRTEYEIAYSYDRTYKGKTTRIISDPIYVTTAKVAGELKNIEYVLKDNTLTVTFDIVDVEESIISMKLYYSGGSKTILPGNNSIVIENVKNFNEEDLKILVMSQIESPTEHIKYITYEHSDFKKQKTSGGSSCNFGSFMILPLIAGIAIIILKKK